MDILIIVLLAILGLIFGSFFCCMGFRIPNKIDTVKKRSFCPKCEKTLTWYMNIPLISYIIQKGKCKYCKKNIDIIYPFIELTTSILFVGNYLMFGLSFEFYVSIVISSALMITIVSDFLYFYISDRVIILSTIALIVINLILRDPSIAFYQVLYGIISFGLMYLIKKMGDSMFKKESLGGGDVKLMAVIGLAVCVYPELDAPMLNIVYGIIPLLVVLFVASVIGIIFSFIMREKNKEGILPFGPFLLISVIIIMYIDKIFVLF